MAPLSGLDSGDGAVPVICDPNRFAAHGDGAPQARVYRRREGGWQALAGGLPEPRPAMPYALVAADGRLFAGLADGQIWESTNRADTWRACALQGDALTGLRALAYA